MNPVSNEPVVLGAVAALLVWLAARYGIQLSAEQASAAAAAVVVVLTPFVRQLVRPTAKDQPPDNPPGTA